MSGNHSEPAQMAHLEETRAEDEINKLIAVLRDTVQAHVDSANPNPDDKMPTAMPQDMLPQTTNSAHVETHHDSQDSRYREVANDDFEEEWWETCSESDSSSGSDSYSIAKSSEEAEDDDEKWSISAAEEIHREEMVLMPLARPQLNLFINGHLRRYAMINWQIDCIEAREGWRDLEEQEIQSPENMSLHTGKTTVTFAPVDTWVAEREKQNQGPAEHRW